MKKTHLSLSIALAMALAPALLLTGCGGSDNKPDAPTSPQGDGSGGGSAGGGGGAGGGSEGDATNTAAFNTLVSSELMFNPTINSDTALATQYLNSELGTSGALTSDQATALMASIDNAKALAPDQPYKAVAAVVDKVVMTDTFDVSVTAEEISAQKFVKKDMQLGTQKVTWEESHHDEDPRGMVVLNGRNLAVVATDEHNSLIVIDTVTAEIKSQMKFGDVVGPRYTVDAITGASEHGLRYIKAAPDGGSVYVSIRPSTGKAGNDLDDRYGLFRVVIDADGQSAAHDHASTTRYDSEFVGAIHVTSDGKVYVEDIDAEVIRVLSADLVDSGEILTLPTDLDIADVFFTDDSTVYVSTKGVDAAPDAVPPTLEVSAMLHKVDSSTGTVTASMDIYTAPDGLVLFDDGKQALIYEEHHYAAILNLNTMMETRVLPLSEDLDQVVQTGTVTPDGHYAILSGHHKSEVWIFDLTLPVSRMEKLAPADTVIRALAADANGGIYAAGRDGFVDVSQLVVGDVLTPSQAIATDKDFITEESLNSGLPLSVIVSDLSLYSEVPAGGGASIAWSTGGSSINMMPTEDNSLGAVTRPQGSDEVSTLTAGLSYTFRDATQTDSLSFDTLVRQAPAELAVQGEPQAGGRFPNGYVEYMDVSPDGSTAVAGFRGDGGFNVITRDGTDGGAEYALATTDDEGNVTSQVFPAPYAGKRPAGVQFLDNGTVMIAMPEGEDDAGNTSPGALLIYGVDAGSITDGVAPLQSTLVQDGKVLSLSHNVGGKIAVVIETDTERKASIVSATDPSAVESEITLSASARAIALSSDAQSVFVIEEDGIGKYSGTSGARAAHAESTDDFKPRSLVMSEGVVYVGTTNGKLFRFSVADLSSAGDSFISGYGGRVQTIDVVDGKAYMSIWGFGVAVIDPEASKEEAFFAHKRQRRAGVSDDGEYIFAAQYLGRTANEIVVLKK